MMRETYFVTTWVGDNKTGILEFGTASNLLTWIDKNKLTKFTVYIANECPLDWS